jgi:hypothetical protein
MDTRQHRTSFRAKVAIVFEPSRLAAEHLADAYARVVPVVSRRSRHADQPMTWDLPRRARS